MSKADEQQDAAPLAKTTHSAPPTRAELLEIYKQQHKVPVTLFIMHCGLEIAYQG